MALKLITMKSMIFDYLLNQSDYLKLLSLGANTTIENMLNHSDVGSDQNLVEMNRSYYDLANDSSLSGLQITRSNLEILLVTTALILLILATILGNIFVISAIVIEKNLKCVGNYLVLSLAVTDLLVACLVMPLGAVYEILQEWTFGSEMCELWTSVDVLCCTASILHLMAIALDRFWAVTNVDYVHQRNARHIGAMILTVWMVAGIISLAPILGWKDEEFDRRVKQEKRCLVSQDVAYQIFATICSFYAPSGLVLFLYYRIYLEARKRIRRKSSNVVAHRRSRPNSCSPATTNLTTELTTANSLAISSSNGSSENSCQVLISTNTRNLLYPPSNGLSAVIVPDFISSTSDCLDVPSIEIQKDSDSNCNDSTPESQSCSTITFTGNGNNEKCRAQKIPLKRFKLKRRKFSSESDVECKRERKAAKTLAIITGIFIACWLPFFVVALIMPLCPNCYISPHLFSFCLWLGWANSSVNPFLYTIFSPDFRCAFRKMLFGRKQRTKR